jgi:hypothetical protein
MHAFFASFVPGGLAVRGWEEEEAGRRMPMGERMGGGVGGEEDAVSLRPSLSLSFSLFQFPLTDLHMKNQVYIYKHECIHTYALHIHTYTPVLPR